LTREGGQQKHIEAMLFRNEVALMVLNCYYCHFKKQLPLLGDIFFLLTAKCRIYILKKTYCQVSTQIIVTICIVTIYQEGGIMKVLTYKKRQKK